MCRIDITADLNDEDETGYVWTFLDEARDPGQIKPGAIIVVGDEDTGGGMRGDRPRSAGDGPIVGLGFLPGLVEDYHALVGRALASWDGPTGLGAFWPGTGRGWVGIGCRSATRPNRPAHAFAQGDLLGPPISHPCIMAGAVSFRVCRGTRCLDGLTSISGMILQ